MGVEQRFYYPVQIFKEASGIDAFKRGGFWAGVEEFMTPLYYRLNHGRFHTISIDIVSSEIGFYLAGPALTVGLLETNILLSLGIKFGLNIAEHVGADLLGYFADKRRVAEIIRTEQLPFP